MSVKRYQVSGYEWELEEAGTRADVPVDEWPEVLVAATDFDALASRLEEAERSPWVPADKAPAGHSGIVRVEMAEGMWRYEFGEWRVARGIEGWFNNEGGALIGVTLWMPIPDDKAALSLVRL